MTSLKIGFFSDTHLRENLIFPEDVDLFFHCGDLLNQGSMDELRKAAKYFKTRLEGRSIYFTPGNHDNVFESSRKEEALEVLKDAGFKVFIDGGTIISLKGISILVYFMPWVPETVPSHSFNLEDDLRVKFIDKIPHHIDILITHGPPSGILDSEEGKYGFGDELLLKKLSVLRSSLKVHAFGHVHQGRGVMRPDPGSPLFINASTGLRGPCWPIVLIYPECEVPFLKVEQLYKAKNRLE